jgi:UDP-N-acetylglucosamine 2-epimerase (non-hydrolysing)
LTARPLEVVVLVGTRPEAIKMVPVVQAMAAAPGDFHPVLVSTGQHREMLDQVLDLFGIRPALDLGIMEARQDLFTITTKALTGLREALGADTLQEGGTGSPAADLVLVQGDTTTSFAGALAAYYLKIPVGHVEAGLRTYDKRQPFPEEVNRALITQIADLHFAPTQVSRDNLLRAGVDASRIEVTGNTVIDALLQVVDDGYRFDAFPELDAFLARATEDGTKVVLVTAHRRENWGAGIESLARAIEAVLARRPGTRFVFSTHLNPLVRDHVLRLLGHEDRVILTPPLPYDAFSNLMARCHLLLSDSGGVQEEAPSLGKPVLLLRRVTERPEGVDAGTVRVVGTDEGVVVAEVLRLLHDEAAYAAMASIANPYGDGRAAVRITEAILRHRDALPSYVRPPLS